MSWEEAIFYVFIVFFVFAYLTRKPKRPKKQYYDDKYTNTYSDPYGPEDQLDVVNETNYFSKKLMNHFEYKVFKTLQKGTKNKGYLFSQVCLGEFIGCRNNSEEDHLAFRLINTKRVDFLIIGFHGKPLVAIECQGSGHYQNNADHRDAIKATALASANIPLMEIFERENETEILVKLNQSLDH